MGAMHEAARPGPGPAGGGRGVPVREWETPGDSRETVGHAWMVKRALFESRVLGVEPGPVHVHPKGVPGPPLGYTWSYRLGDWVDESRFNVQPDGQPDGSGNSRGVGEDEESHAGKD